MGSSDASAIIMYCFDSNEYFLINSVVIIKLNMYSPQCAVAEKGLLSSIIIDAIIIFILNDIILSFFSSHNGLKLSFTFALVHSPGQ
jgi:hypothetical protein